MLFLTPWFWAFAAPAVLLYRFVPARLRLVWLLGASAVFHWHFAGPAGVAPIVVLGAATYAVGLWPRRLGRWSTVGLVITALVAALAFYKYARFALDNLVLLAASLGIALPSEVARWVAPAAPLGISFFTFEFVHYLYEVHWHGRAPIRSPLQFALFSIFFPTLATGPIKRFPDFVPQLDALTPPDWERFWGGLGRVIRGLFKKVCVADLLVEYIAVFEQVPHPTAPLVVGLAVLQGWRIYYDFAGYTDMAVGLAQMLNLSVPENFNRPYGSTSLQEFWRRWHMSLSSWIRDYVYIPLGGNRVRRGFNLLLAMVICGLWHGPAWHFAAWGAYHGLGLGLESALRRRWPGLFAERWPQRALGWAVCYAFVNFGWLVFFYPLGTVWKLTRALLVWP
ncbi:MAG: MBOAT family O-acyltransferase [Deltaproteobacteria bacterium]|nr:MBOAT family O-acyltransferase [Deltaproteobacteria bacterium]